MDAVDFEVRQIVAVSQPSNAFFMRVAVAFNVIINNQLSLYSVKSYKKKYERQMSTFLIKMRMFI